MVDFYSKLVIVFIKKETVEYFSTFSSNSEKFEPNTDTFDAMLSGYFLPFN